MMMTMDMPMMIDGGAVGGVGDGDADDGGEVGGGDDIGGGDDNGNDSDYEVMMLLVTCFYCLGLSMLGINEKQ